MGETSGLGERVRRLRHGKGWTLEQLANEAGVSKGFMSAVENGHNTPSGKILLKLGRALGASVDYLVQGDEGPAGPAVERARKVEIPAELVELAELESWSFPKVRKLVEAREAVIARRSEQARRPYTTTQWRELAATLAPFIDKNNKKD